MQTEEVLNWLKEGMAAEDVTEVLLAVLAGWDRINPNDELVWLSLPKYDKSQREQIIKQAMRMQDG